MRLALLIGAFPPGPFGGAETQAAEWARRLSRRHEVTVITRRLPADRPRDERRDGYRIVSLPVAPIALVRTWRDRAAVTRVIAGLDPRPDLALCFQTFVSGWIGVHLQRRMRIPAVVWVRGEDEIRLARWRTRLTSPAVWSAARGVLVQSDEMRAALVAELDPRSRAVIEPKLAVVPNGIEMPRAAPQTAWRGDRVLVVGRLRAIKGVDLVIEAVAAAGGRLTVAGDGPERARLEEAARARHLDARFLGTVGRATLDTLYREAACLVLASRFGEGLPNVVLEAMAHGCPVIATRVTGVTTLVQDGVNGLVVPPHDVPALRDAVIRLGREPELATRLGAGGRATAGCYAWSAVMPRLEEVMARWGTR